MSRTLPGSSLERYRCRFATLYPRLDHLRLVGLCPPVDTTLSVALLASPSLTSFFKLVNGLSTNTEAVSQFTDIAMVSLNVV